MGDKSKIAWCDATINPAYGCFPASPGCQNCYAAKMAPRLGVLTDGTHSGGKWTGKVNLFPERMAQALRWKKPRRIFVGSMTDLFHEAVPDAFLDDVFAYMALAHWHTFIVLTKRPKRMLEYFKNEDVALRVGETEPVYEAKNLVNGEDDAMTASQQKRPSNTKMDLTPLGIGKTMDSFQTSGSA